jgi:hypothetical protein
MRASTQVLIRSARRGVALVIASCACALCGGGHAQPAAIADAVASAPPAVGDEVVVIGKSPGQLRAEMENAEVAVYDRFNELNSDNQFDIHCRRDVPINSHIASRRVCQANFSRDEEARAAQARLQELQGGAAVNPQIFLNEEAHKRELLRQEMRRVAAEDDAFRKSLVRFADLKKAFDGAMHDPARTKSAEQTASQEALPYGAALAADVHIGRRPWRHALTERTFTFAQLQGELTRLEVACAGRIEQLTYVESAEWTLPADWHDCELRVEAPHGTTFTLYEFE